MNSEVANLIEIRITTHRWKEPKWSFDSSYDRYRNPDYGLSGYYKHAKFTLPSGKKKCLRYGDIPDDQIIADIAWRHQNLKFAGYQSR